MDVSQLKKGVLLLALEDFTGETDDELSFKEGELIRFLEKDSSGWAAGERGMQVGWFPVSFVTLAHQPAAPVPPPVPPPVHPPLPQPQPQQLPPPQPLPLPQQSQSLPVASAGVPSMYREPALTQPAPVVAPSLPPLQQPLQQPHAPASASAGPGQPPRSPRSSPQQTTAPALVPLVVPKPPTAATAPSPATPTSASRPKPAPAPAAATGARLPAPTVVPGSAPPSTAAAAAAAASVAAGAPGSSSWRSKQRGPGGKDLSQLPPPPLPPDDPYAPLSPPPPGPPPPTPTGPPASLPPATPPPPPPAAKVRPQPPPAAAPVPPAPAPSPATANATNANGKREARGGRKTYKFAITATDFEGYAEWEQQYKQQQQQQVVAAAAPAAAVGESGVDNQSILGPTRFRNSVRLAHWIATERAPLQDIQRAPAATPAPASSSAAAAAAAAAKKKGLVTRIFKKDERARPTVFGQPLEALLVGKKGARLAVPRVVQDCVTYLSRADRLTEAGLLRISGDHSQMEKLRFVYASPADSAELEKLRGLEVHTVAGLLKQFLQALPEPLFSYQVSELALEAAGAGRVELELCRNLLKVVPAAARPSVDLLFAWLRRVADHASVNLMTPTNIALVLGPTLVRPRIETPESLLRRSDARFVEVLITHYDELFPKRPPLQF